MVDKKETVKSWLDDHDFDEIVETTKLAILPKYDIIPENDLTTIRKIQIVDLPVDKHVKTKEGKELDLTFITIAENGIHYSLPFNSKALQRSFVALAIKFSNATTKAEIDFATVLGKTVGIKREQFTAQGFTQSPLKFFVLEK